MLTAAATFAPSSVIAWPAYTPGAGNNVSIALTLAVGNPR